MVKLVMNRIGQKLANTDRMCIVPEKRSAAAIGIVRLCSAGLVVAWQQGTLNGRVITDTHPVSLQTHLLLFISRYLWSAIEYPHRMATCSSTAQTTSHIFLLIWYVDYVVAPNFLHPTVWNHIFNVLLSLLFKQVAALLTLCRMLQQWHREWPNQRQQYASPARATDQHQVKESWAFHSSHLEAFLFSW